MQSRTVVSLSSLAVLLGIVVACGGSDTDATGDAPPSAGSEAGAPPAAGEPVTGTDPDGAAPGADAAGEGGPTVTAGDDAPFAAKRASCAYHAGAVPSATFGASVDGAKIPIDTFVVVSQENRSFDHYFSMLPAFGQPDVDVASPTATLPGVGGVTVSRFHQTDYCFADTAHDWGSMHACWDGGKNDGFAKVNGERSLGYFDATDLPFYYALASTFGTSDRYFAPVLSKTGANRLYLYAATSAGSIDSNPGITTTIFDRLSAAGKTWKVYRNATYSFEQAIFPYLLTNYPDHFKSLADFAADAAAGTLPNLATIYVGPDEHPPADMQKGQLAVSKVYGTLAASPQWQRSAFVWTYDEAGGLYDHVAPPKACAPDAIPPKVAAGSAPGDFAQYGFRVPMVIASPWSKPHHVSHVTNDHTSILRLIELRFGLAAMTARDANANALLDVFDFTKLQFAAAPAMPVPTATAGHGCP